MYSIHTIYEVVFTTKMPKSFKKTSVEVGQSTVKPRSYLCHISIVQHLRELFARVCRKITHLLAAPYIRCPAIVSISNIIR